MKKLLTEEEIKHIKKIQNINESFFSDLLSGFKDSKFAKSVLDLLNKYKNDEGSKKNNSEKISLNFKDIKINRPSSSDDMFYKKVLEGINADTTNENMLFFYAWRQAEGAKATYNPFNTTQGKDGSTLWNCLRKKGGQCVGGVRNYKSESDGIESTIKTLKNGHYPCIVNGLKNNTGAVKISECSDLKVWGTGDLVKKVLSRKTISPPEISRTLVKKI